jgi:hypothetical protein
MALIKCTECQNDISELAPTCPICGVLRKTGRGCFGWLVITGLVLFVLSVILFLIGLSVPLKPASITYQVDGSAKFVSLTYNNEEGGTQQRKVSLPWKESFETKPGSFLYISAQNQNEYGSLTVSIFVDGKPFRTSYASGGYTIASASGRCCE